MANNFIDPQTGEEFFFSNFIMIPSSSGVIYKDKSTKKILVNPNNGNVLEIIKREGKIEAPLIMKSNDKATRVKMLKKRSNEHFKKEISECKYEMNKKLINQYKGK